MRSMNSFIDNVTRSYKTAANAQRAFDKATDGVDGLTGSLLIAQRSDGRYAVIIVNPGMDAWHYFVHACQFGVYGIQDDTLSRPPPHSLTR